MAGIYYGGHSVLAADNADGAISQFLDYHLNTADLRMFGDRPISLTSFRMQSRSKYRAHVGLPLPNYSTPPRIKFNTLYWPTGVTRWAHCHVLVTWETLDKILDDSHGGIYPLTLEMSDGIDGLGVKGVIQVKMYHLPPRQITCVDAAADLWMVPLVDERYFIHEKHSGNLTLSEGTSWTLLYQMMMAQAGITIALDGISGNYYYVDAVEFSRKYENVAVILDSIAHNVGHRIVKTLDGAFASQAWTTAEAALFASLNPAHDLRQLAGTDAVLPLMHLAQGIHYPETKQCLIPEAVVVTFPITVDNVPHPLGNVYALQRAATVFLPANITLAATTKTFHDTLQAKFTVDGTGPLNSTELGNCATEIARDFYRQISHAAYDLKIAGICTDWTPCAFDDYIEYAFGHRRDDGSFECETRIHGLPYNFGVEEQNHQTPDTSSSSSIDTGSSSSGSGSGSEAPPGWVLINVVENITMNLARCEMTVGHRGYLFRSDVVVPLALTTVVHDMDCCGCHSSSSS